MQAKDVEEASLQRKTERRMKKIGREMEWSGCGGAPQWNTCNM